MKNAKRILSGLLALVMVLAMCPMGVFAAEGEDVTINIAELSNGTVTTDKESYKVGDTVTLTVAANGGHKQKLYVNGEPVILGWKSNTYSFVATESVYDITGSFVPELEMYAGDWGRWDNNNQAHGLLRTRYPNDNDSWWNKFKGEYTSISMNAKNYWAVEDSYEGSANGGWRVMLYMQLDNGNYYAFSMWINTEKKYAYNHYGGKIDGVVSTTGWGGAWCLVGDKNAEAMAALNGDGAEFKLERIDGNHIQVTLDGTVLETYEIPGVTEANKVISVGMQHNGNKGEQVDIPFKLTKPSVEVNLPADLEHGSITADKDSYEKGDTVNLTISRENGYFQKLFINGEPMMMDWKSNTYSFVATEPVYDITGSFVRSINHTASDWGRWDDYDQGHGILSTYYPNHNDSWWMTFNGDYQSATVGVKNYLPRANTLDNFMVYLKVTMDNGRVFNFRVYTDPNGSYAYSRAGIQNEGDASADWGHWTGLSSFNSIIDGEGASFKVERTAGNELTLSLDGQVLDTYTMAGVTAENKIANIAVEHQGNQGERIDMPFYLQAVDAPAAQVIIPELANGTVTADKESYKVGDTVTLTIAPNAGYFQKLYVNGEPIVLGWKTFTYSFVAKEAVNEITGSFETGLNLAPNEWGRWDDHNQAHGLLSTYYPSNDDSWWMEVKGNYESAAVRVKNYMSIADTLDNFMVVLRVTMDNGRVFLFRVFTDKGGYYAYNRAGIKNEGDASADWSHWKNLSSFNDIISGEGATFKVERTAGNVLTLSLDGQVLDTYTMAGVTADNKVSGIAVKHQGNKGATAVIPFEVKLPHVHQALENSHECACGTKLSDCIDAEPKNHECDICGAEMGVHEYVDGKCDYCGDVLKFTVTWVNWDGALLETDENVPYGTAPEFNGETPTKAADDTYTYEFIGWDAELAPVTGDVTYTAQYQKTEIEEEYPVIFSETVKHSVLYKDKVQLQFFFTVVNKELNASKYGVLIWTADEYAAEYEAFLAAKENKTLYTSETVYYAEMGEQNGMQRGTNEGQKPREMHQYYKAIPYALVDGEYYYGNVDQYSIMDYADNILTKSANAKSKAAVESLLRFAKFTQLYLDKTMDVSCFEAVLEKHGLSTDLVWTEADNALVVEQLVVNQPEYSANVMAWRGSSLLMKDQTGLCFVVNGKLTEEYEVLYWTEADYKAAGGNPVVGTESGELSVMAYSATRDQGLKSGISARLSGDAYYVRLYNKTTGEYGQVKADSVATCLARMVNKYEGDAENEINLKFAKAYLLYAEKVAAALATN